MCAKKILSSYVLLCLVLSSSVGKRLRCTWNCDSGDWKKVVNGRNILGGILTINGKAQLIGLKFSSKHGRKNTEKPSILMGMKKRVNY